MALQGPEAACRFGAPTAAGPEGQGDRTDKADTRQWKIKTNSSLFYEALKSIAR